MLILGLLLLAGTAAFTGLVIADNLSGGPDYNVTVLGHHIATMNSLAIFCAGLALALIFGLGLMLATAGGALRRRRVRKLGAARRDAQASARERDELAARLAADEPAATGAAPAYEEDPSRRGAVDDMAANRDAAAGSATRTQPHRGRHARHLFGH